jgi:acyl-CoA hydrolase
MIEKRVSESRVTLSHLMLPQDANPAGNVHGGVIMKLVDNAAGVAAARHCRAIVVTASIDQMDFHVPVYIGDLVTFRASINLAGKTSMEVGVHVESENLLTGVIRHVASAYLTFVALFDKDDEHRQVPHLILETDDDKRRHKEAIIRRHVRLEERDRKRSKRMAD